MIPNIDPMENNFSSSVAGPKFERHNLKKDSLSNLEVLAQSVSVIAPSTVPAAILGLIFASAGNGVWLSFVLGMIGLVLVSLNINQFARRSASSGSLYAFIVRGLGPTAGVLGGWALLCGYTITGMSTLCGFSVVATDLLGKLGMHSNPLVLFAVGTALAAYIAFRDIALSAKLMLISESLALLAVSVLAIAVWWHKGFAIDPAQMHLTGATPSGVILGIVLVVFGFSGFESATSLGDEAREPLRSIPRSVLASVVVSGIFFTFVAYIAVLGFQGLPTTLDKAEAPLDLLANNLGLGPLGIAISIGVLLSFFSCTLASINGTARIVFSMARHRLFVDALGEAHEKNETPYVAVAVAALITFAAPAILYVFGVGAFDAQGYFGTLCSFGFLFVYILISIAAPFYLHAIGQLNARAILYSVAGVAFMILPFVGTVGIPSSKMFPPPAFPNNLLFGIFIVYMIVGFAYLQFQRVRDPKLIPMMKTSIEHVEARFQEPASIEPLPAQQ
jgi:amino acid transporter